MKQQVNVAIRLNAEKHRKLRQQVVRQRTSIQRVLEELIDKWIADSDEQPAPADLRGFLRGSGVMELRQHERQAELERDRSQM